MSTLGDRIKLVREQKGLLQSQLASLIGVKSSGVISNWEKGINKPDADKIVKLCEVLDISVSYLLNYHGKSQLELDPLEKKLIEKFRRLDVNEKKVVDSILDSILVLSEEKKKNLLSEATNSVNEKLIMYTYAQHMAYAGEGFYFDDLSTDLIEAPEYPGADFVIGVNGDSMEPTYSDGDNVYIKKACELNYGEVGLFVMDNSAYIKEYTKEGLVSHNKSYPLIAGRDDIRIIGKVLGKVSKKAKIIRK